MSKARDLAGAATALNAVTPTELGYLDGVTSAVQTQVDAKIAKSTVTTKGDLLAATASATVARLGTGTDGQVLTAASGETTGLQWATPASGGMTLLASGTLSGTSVSLTSISQSYKNLIIYMRDYRNSGGTNDAYLGVNSNNTTLSIELQNSGGTYQAQAQSIHYINFNVPTVDTDAHAYIVIPDYTAASVALAQSWAYVKASNSFQSHRYVSSAYPATTTAITSIQLNANATFGAGTYELWGQK
jgi:hypothetical protein